MTRAIQKSSVKNWPHHMKTLTHANGYPMTVMEYRFSTCSTNYVCLPKASVRTKSSTVMGCSTPTVVAPHPLWFQLTIDSPLKPKVIAKKQIIAKVEGTVKLRNYSCVHGFFDQHECTFIALRSPCYLQGSHHFYQF